MKKVLLSAIVTLGALDSLCGMTLSDSSIATLGVLSTQKAGVLDTTWPSGGSMVYDPGGTDICGDVKVSKDGSVFVSGKKDSTAFIVKFDNKGILKSEFGINGQLTNGTSSNGFISLALDESTNTLYALGTNGVNSYVFAYNATTGAVITTFSVTLSGQAQATGLAIDGTGLYILVGTGSVGNLYKVNLATGALDNQFNSGTVISLGSDFYTPLGIKVRNGFVYVNGTISGSPYTTTVHKRNGITGALVWSSSCPENPYPGNPAYGYNDIGVDSKGVVYVPVDNGHTSGVYSFAAQDGSSSYLITIGSASLDAFLVSGVYVDSMDKILLIGTVPGGFGPARITRLLSGGSSIDTSFGSNGTITNPNMDRTNQFTHATLDYSGKIIFVGTTSGGNIVVARYTGGMYEGAVSQVLMSNQNLGNARGLSGIAS